MLVVEIVGDCFRCFVLVEEDQRLSGVPRSFGRSLRLRLSSVKNCLYICLWGDWSKMCMEINFGIDRFRILKIDKGKFQCVVVVEVMVNFAG